MKTLVGIVLYNPEIQLLRKNVNAIYRQNIDVIPHIHIIDNGSKNKKEIDELLKEYVDVSMEFNINNIGIAAALNQIMLYAMRYGYDWVLSLDQDSIIPRNMLQEYEAYLNSTHNDAIGILSPRIEDRNLKIRNHDLGIKAIEVDKCITSGSLLKTSIWNQVGRYNEWMFIDFVDLDICAKVRKAGYKIYRINDVVLSHALGESTEHRIFGHRIISTNHSPIRHYYYSRNLIYFSKKYGCLYHDYNFKKMWVIEFLNAILFENNKMQNTAMMIKGAIDYYFHKGRNKI